MSEADLRALYSPQLLALAADIPHLGALAGAEGRARLRSPVCGSSLGVDVALDHGRVSALGLSVRACALGQASAAIMGRVAVGLTLAQAEAGLNAVQAMLEGGAVPAAPFDGYALLAPAQSLPARHAAILLAPQALVAAIRAAMGAEGGEA